MISVGKEDTIYFEDYGSGPGLVCIHGLGGEAHFFAPEKFNHVMADFLDTILASSYLTL